MRFEKNLAGLALGAALCLPAAAADLTIVYNVTVNGKTGTTTEYFTSNKFRSGDGQHDMIVDTAAGSIVSIDHARKEYSQVTVAEIEASLQKASAQMEEAMKNMPPALREKMEAISGGSAVSVSKVAGGKTVAGHATDRYIITVGPSETESFNAPSLVPPIEPGEMMRFQSLANPMMKAAHKMAAEMQKIKGMTLASSTTVKVMGKTFTTSKEATEVKTGPVPPGAFDIPAGYKKVNSPLTKGR